jgi:hypothetical protein
VTVTALQNPTNLLAILAQSRKLSPDDGAYSALSQLINYVGFLTQGPNGSTNLGIAAWNGTSGRILQDTTGPTLTANGRIANVTPGVNPNDVATVTSVNSRTNVFQSYPSGGSTSTFAMMGFNASISTISTGNVLFIVSGDIYNTSADPVKAQLLYAIGSPPSTTGLKVSGLIEGTCAAGSQRLPFCVQGVINVGIGVTAYFDMLLWANSGGTAFMENCSATAVEV